jgi:crossover junction endodeoxyribonuclease RusA
MMDISFYLPFPPSVNSLYVHTKRGVRLSNKGVLYVAKTKAELVEQLGDLSIDYRVMVQMILFPPCDRKRDIDNFVKALQDSMTKAQFWDDDSSVDQLIVFRGETLRPSGSVFVRVLEAAPLIKFGSTESLLFVLDNL